MRTTTPDPHAENYYNTSPYAWCGNNPISRVDLDGRDVYIINKEGKVTLALKQDEDDRLFSMDSNGRLSGNNLIVSDKNILPSLANNSVAETTNSKDAFNLFTFAANNSEVEWGLAGFRNNNTTNFVINTDKKKYSVTYNRGKNSESDLLFHVHSHPDNDNGSRAASGYELYFDNLKLGNSDAEFMKDRFNAAKEINKQWPSEYPKLFIYHKNSQTLYHYNHKVSSQKVSVTTSPLHLRSLINQFRITP